MPESKETKYTTKEIITADIKERTNIIWEMMWGQSQQTDCAASTNEIDAHSYTFDLGCRISNLDCIARGKLAPPYFQVWPSRHLYSYFLLSRVHTHEQFIYINADCRLIHHTLMLAHGRLVKHMRRGEKKPGPVRWNDDCQREDHSYHIIFGLSCLDTPYTRLKNQ